MEDTFYTLEEVSEMTMLTTRTIRNYISKGLVRPEKINGKWMFSKESFISMLEMPYVGVAVDIKHSQIVQDFLLADKKQQNEACLVIDRKDSEFDETKIKQLMEQVDKLKKENEQVQFVFQKKDAYLRMYLTGPEEQVRNVFLGMAEN